MRGEFRLIRHMGEGVVVIAHPSGDMALWARVAVRKPHRCVVSDAELRRGDLAYRPVGNQSYRMERIAAEIIDITPVDDGAAASPDTERAPKDEAAAPGRHVNTRNGRSSIGESWSRCSCGDIFFGLTAEEASDALRAHIDGSEDSG